MKGRLGLNRRKAIGYLQRMIGSLPSVGGRSIDAELDMDLSVGLASVKNFDTGTSHVRVGAAGLSGKSKLPFASVSNLAFTRTAVALYHEYGHYFQNYGPDKDILCMISEVSVIRNMGCYFDAWETLPHEIKAEGMGVSLAWDAMESMFHYRHMTQDAVGEAEQAAFVKLFGQILVSRNLLNTFDEFAGNEILTPRQFDDYKGWYLHPHDTMSGKRSGSANSGDNILDGLEFHVELVNEETVGIDAILVRIGREAEKNRGTGPVINADALSAIQAAVDVSVTMRKKKRLLELFLAQVNNGGDASGAAFLALAAQVYDDAVEQLIADLKLRDGADEFIRRCVDAGYVLETGSGLDAILPPVRRFGGGKHGMIREQAIEKIQLIVDEFEGLYISL